MVEEVSVAIWHSGCAAKRMNEMSVATMDDKVV